MGFCKVDHDMTRGQKKVVAPTSSFNISKGAGGAARGVFLSPTRIYQGQYVRGGRRGGRRGSSEGGDPNRRDKSSRASTCTQLKAWPVLLMVPTAPSDVEAAETLDIKTS